MPHWRDLPQLLALLFVPDGGSLNEGLGYWVLALLFVPRPQGADGGSLNKASFMGQESWRPQRKVVRILSYLCRMSQHCVRLDSSAVLMSDCRCICKFGMEL